MFGIMNDIHTYIHADIQTFMPIHAIFTCMHACMQTHKHLLPIHALCICMHADTPLCLLRQYTHVMSCT